MKAETVIPMRNQILIQNARPAIIMSSNNLWIAFSLSSQKIKNRDFVNVTDMIETVEINMISSTELSNRN